MKSVLDVLEKYNLSSVDTQVDGLDFETLVRSIISNGVADSLPQLWNRIVIAATAELRENVTGICQILVIAVFTALFTNFASVFADSSVSDTGKKLSRIAAVTVMAAAYTCTAGIAYDVLASVTGFIKMLMPAYLSCVALCSGNFSAAAFSEGVMLAVLVLNYVFSDVVITGGSIYVMIMAADAITGGGLDKIAGLIMTVLKWIIKSSMAAVIGINLIQGMVAPMADGVNRGVLTRAVGLIPGIGGGVRSRRQRQMCIRDRHTFISTSWCRRTDKKRDGCSVTYCHSYNMRCPGCKACHVYGDVQMCGGIYAANVRQGIC